MAWNSQSPEFWLGLVLLVATIAAIIPAALSKKADARMEFFSRLFENIPPDEVPSARNDETNPAPPKEKT